MKNGSGNRTIRIIILLAGITVAIGSVIWVLWVGAGQTKRASEATATNQPVPPVDTASAAGQASPAPPTTNLPAKTVRELVARHSPESGRGTVDELRRHIASLTTNAASKEIRDALDSRTDAQTGMGFKLTSNGTLAQAPTLRTFLLDQLAQVDPAAAAAYAEKILNSPDSADEWAVAMRSCALVRTNAESRAFLQQKFREMVTQDSWRNAPSVGFLEAFDVAVHLGGKELLPDLTTLVRDKDNRAVAHAAYLTLDRLTINDPVTTLAELQRQPDAMAGREATRANYFARANVGDPDQRTIIENYLLDPKLSPAELQTFAGIFPNANYMVSPNLLTPTVTPDHGTLRTRDRLALDAVNQWLADSRFAKVQPQLEKMRQRLEMFVRQADGTARAAQ